MTLRFKSYANSFESLSESSLRLSASLDCKILSTRDVLVLFSSAFIAESINSSPLPFFSLLLLDFLSFFYSVLFKSLVNSLSSSSFSSSLFISISFASSYYCDSSVYDLTKSCSGVIISSVVSCSFFYLIFLTKESPSRASCYFFYFFLVFLISSSTIYSTSSRTYSLSVLPSLRADFFFVDGFLEPLADVSAVFFAALAYLFFYLIYFSSSCSTSFALLVFLTSSLVGSKLLLSLLVLIYIS